ncbi:hypothetical protein CU103_30870 [Phyllobacterium sophorae]|uniref:Uncharacterized protein n=2 Tax=Phyllobacterium sophorae TaxID=1520277 RepID=A0A2P7AM28_9HYPH|nr:hypothetical protein CU103_30870 [Phyllobacterium sophorae]
MPVSSNPLKGADIAAAFSGSGRSTPHHTNNRSAFVEHLRLSLVAAELEWADLHGPLPIQLAWSKNFELETFAERMAWQAHQIRYKLDP